MKFGMHTSSIKRLIKSRSTGRVKRAINGVINPLHGRKGVGGYVIQNVQRTIRYIRKRHCRIGIYLNKTSI